MFAQTVGRISIHVWPKPSVNFQYMCDQNFWYNFNTCTAKPFGKMFIHVWQKLLVKFQYMFG